MKWLCDVAFIRKKNHHLSGILFIVFKSDEKICVWSSNKLSLDVENEM